MPGGNRSAVDRLDTWRAPLRNPGATSAGDRVVANRAKAILMNGEPPRNRACLASPQGEANLPEDAVAKPDRAKRGMVTLNFASWNQIAAWLKHIDALRRAAA